MALDLSRFAKAFFEEAQEHIHALESLLVGINLRSPGEETLNAVFRAVHSVKGGAAAFGHSALADFTHDFENILDRVRKGKLALSKPMVDLFLRASDVMRQHLAALEQDATPDLAAMASMKESLNLMGSEAPPPAADEPAAVPRFRVSIRLPRAEFGDETLEALAEDMRGLGEVSDIETEIIDAASLEYRFSLNTEHEADELRESLEFLVPAEAIDIGSPPRPTPMAADEEETAYEFFGDDDDEPAPPIESASAPAAESDISLASLTDATSIRVNVLKVDQLINLVGELVIAEAMLSQASRQFSEQEQTHLAAGLAQLERNTRDLQDAVLAIRMLPISFVFSRLPRLTRDLADRLGKEVELEMHGEETELDKSVIEKIADPLTHLVRNALDHGIETADVRVAKGKPRAGRLVVRAAHQGGNIMISVSDDGAGLSRERILDKARELDLIAGDSWKDEEVWQLIFTPGFSTAAQITDVSGRGVGMDVVWQNVHALGGKIDIDSEPEAGTTITIRLPLTLAILDGMSISASGETYILPLANIAQSLHPAAADIKTINGLEVVMVRDEYVPITSLSHLFNLPASKQDKDILVVLEMDGRRGALRVDELLGQHQVVLKSLETNYRKVRGVSGATILGDGRVALILDVAYLVSIAHTLADEESGYAHV